LRVNEGNTSDKEV